MKPVASPHDSPWLTLEEVATRLRFPTVKALRRWRERHPHDLVAYKRGGALLFLRSDVDAVPRRQHAGQSAADRVSSPRNPLVTAFAEGSIR